MSTLTAVLIHLEAARVRERMDLLARVAPGARCVVCYGGPFVEFSRVAHAEKLFIDDPTLRGPEQHLQSLTLTFTALWHRYVRGDADVDSVYLIEYDHLVLNGGFDERLRELAAATGADFLGKNCTDRTATNGEHYIRFRRDERLLSFLRRVSVREDQERLFGCLGTGMWLSRAALEAYVGIVDHPPCYCETYVPTLLHHLGCRVVDVDAHGDLYRYVRWIPTFAPDEVTAAQADGAVFMHPVKDPQAVERLRAGLSA